MAGLLRTHPTLATDPDRGERFEDLFDREFLRLYRALWLVTRNRHEAEEIAQDAFVKVLERWDRVSGLEDPVGYLYRTGMNVFRSRRRRAAMALRKAIRIAPPDDEMAAIEDRDAAIRALAGLTPRQRAAIVLTELLGMTSEEAGVALGISASTVRVLAARARGALTERRGGIDD